jgi:hypothetical protein
VSGMMPFRTLSIAKRGLACDAAPCGKSVISSAQTSHGESRPPVAERDSMLEKQTLALRPCSSRATDSTDGDQTKFARSSRGTYFDRKHSDRSSPSQAGSSSLVHHPSRLILATIVDARELKMTCCSSCSIVVVDGLNRRASSRATSIHTIAGTFLPVAYSSQWIEDGLTQGKMNGKRKLLLGSFGKDAWCLLGVFGSDKMFSKREL